MWYWRGIIWSKPGILDCQYRPLPHQIIVPSNKNTGATKNLLFQQGLGTGGAVLLRMVAFAVGGILGYFVATSEYRPLQKSTPTTSTEGTCNSKLTLCPPRR